MSALPLILSTLPCSDRWMRVTKFDRAACALADRHYSRQTPGSWQFMPPGQTLVLMTPCRHALFGWQRPHPNTDARRADGLDGWFCSIFRNEGAALASELILDAERVLAATHPDDCGPDGMLTYVKADAIRSTNPGFCFKRAGWTSDGRRSAKSGLVLLTKPFALAGVAP